MRFHKRTNCRFHVYPTGFTIGLLTGRTVLGFDSLTLRAIPSDG